MYVAAFRDGIYKSIDKGITWIRKSNGMPVKNSTNKYVFELRMDPIKKGSKSVNDVIISFNYVTFWVA